jgi:hypothetical protein
MRQSPQGFAKFFGDLPHQQPTPDYAPLPGGADTGKYRTTSMNQPNKSKNPIQTHPRLPDASGRRSTEVRDRLEEFVDRLHSEGTTWGEISTQLAGYVAQAMERTTAETASLPSGEYASGGPVLVNLTNVPLRFSVSAVMTLYHLQSAPSQPARLGETIGISAAAMTGILDTLESRSLITRVRDPRDRRKVHVDLTKEGRRMVDAMFLI